MNGESTHVRRVRPDEWQLWRSLRLQALADSPEAFGSTLEDVKHRSDAYWQELIPTDSVSDRVFLVAELGDCPAGMVRADLLSGTISRAGLYSMWVMPDKRGRGIGKALVNAAVEWARAKGASEVVLQVTEGNHAARQLYLSTGFAAAGIRERVRPGSSLYEETMILSLR